MHNRKKSEAARTEEQEKLVERKKVAYNGLSSQVLERRANGEQSVEVMALTEQLIRVNPDFYSVWNYRREILLGLHAEIGLTEAVPEEKLQSDAAIAVRNFELNLSSAGIKKNPKSYGAWHHRQWILTRIIPDLEAELDLCQQFLKADQRNFHCWNYRRYLVSIGGVRSDSEIEFSTLKIEENFSNYSAFHHRSVYIRQFEVAVPELIEQEMSIVESAIFTDPFDQSAFWYYQVCAIIKCFVMLDFVFKCRSFLLCTVSLKVGGGER